MNAIPQQATLNAKQLETMANRYAADIHFGHANVIKFRGRPIRNAGCMDNVPIENLWKVVGADDDLWIVGDSFCRSDMNII